MPLTFYYPEKQQTQTTTAPLSTQPQTSKPSRKDKNRKTKTSSNKKTTNLPLRSITSSTTKSTSLKHNTANIYLSDSDTTSLPVSAIQTERYHFSNNILLPSNYFGQILFNEHEILPLVNKNLTKQAG